MSIIVRLQNLPLTAKSGDIRRFFGGLRIPDGGVHILGGQKGDAFIIFCSDEDARLALRKDGGKLKDARVKLFLSSRMEMQHEVERITKHSVLDASRKPYTQEKLAENETWHRSSEKTQRRFSRSRSPQHVEDKIKHFNFNPHHERSKSSIEKAVYESRSSSSKYKSQSPRRSRSPHRSLSPKSRTFFKRRSVSPEVHDYAHAPEQVELNSAISHGRQFSEFPDLPVSKSEIQAELERRITEAIEANTRNKFENKNDLLSLNATEKMNLPIGIGEFYSRHSTNTQDAMHLSPLPPVMHANTSAELYRHASETAAFCCEMDRFGEFYIIISGLHPQWNYIEVQMMLKGIFAPQHNIKWEFDDEGFKTGSAFIKLTNKDDFNHILSIATFVFQGHRITVSECPKFISHGNFHTSHKFQRGDIPRCHNLCYALKGLPFSCTYDDIVKFFHGLEINDIIIHYDDDGRADGLGFVSFSNWNDFEAAEAQNGKKIGHRYIKMLRSTDNELAEGKKRNLDSTFYYPYVSLNRMLGSKRSLCIIVTGLPCTVMLKKLLSFFSEAGAQPDAVHLIMNKKNLCDGRAFVEFTKFLNFDAALQLHGKSYDGNIICVKQVLFDEMNNILSSQQAKHYFTTEPSTSSSNLPEKVPYLWEPPDAEHKEKKKNVRSRKRNRNHANKPFPNFEIGKTLGDARHPIYPNFIPGPGPGPGPMNFKLLPNEAMPINNAYHSQGKEDKLSKEMDNFIVENELNVFFRKAVFREDSENPVKFNLNNKKAFVNSKTDKVFNQHSEYMPKLTKLSPEKDIYPPKMQKNKEISPVRKIKYFDAKKSPERKYSHNLKDREGDNSVPRSKNDYYPRNRNKKEFDHDADHKSELHHENQGLSTSLHSESRRLPEDRTKGCVVQLSNVSNSVRTEDLLHFLRGFDFFKDTLTRRYTADEEPTSDVRVTFITFKEARKAIRALNKSPLNGRQITMFLA